MPFFTPPTSRNNCFDSAGESNQFFARKRRLEGPDKSTSHHQAKRKFSLSEEEEEEEEEEFIDEEVLDEDEGLAGMIIDTLSTR